MSDLEGFFGSGGSENIDPASFEKFKERIKAANAQIKAIKAGEHKQKAKEQKLIKILLLFVKNRQKRDIMLLITRLLELNMPASFILSVVILGNEKIMKDIEKEKILKPAISTEDHADLEMDTKFSLSIIDSDQTLPLKLKAEIDKWMKNILNQALEHPRRILNLIGDAEGQGRLLLIKLFVLILRDYLKQVSHESDHDKLKNFGEFFINGIVEKIGKK